MLSRSFKVVAPEILELYIEDINIKKNETLVKIDYATICKADIRYYKGKRDKRVLGLKYPMSLIHEVTGTVIKDSENILKKGDKVVLVPNVVENYDELSDLQINICEDKYLGENYCDKAEFCSSNRDGFSKQYVALPSRNVIKYDESINANIAVFTELISVAIAALRRLDYISKEYDELIVWGDGLLGYIIASVGKDILHKKITVIGKHDDKMKKIPCDNYIHLNDNVELTKLNLQNIIECVGGEGMDSAIDQILRVIEPGGKLVITGVSEDKIQVDTRKILEKGVTITGSTRSNISDFNEAIKYLMNDEFRQSIKKLLAGEIIIRNIYDFYYAFEKTCSENILGKYIMKFEF